MKLYKTFAINGKSQRLEVNLGKELLDCFYYGGIENRLELTQKMLVASITNDKKALLDVLNDEDGQISHSFRHGDEFIYSSWKNELED